MQLPLANKISPFDVQDDCLVIGSRKLTDIVDEIGSTPLYLYSRSMIEDRIGQLRDALPAAVHLRYAVKANPMPELVGMIAKLTDGLDVASAGELNMALTTGMTAEQISFAGPGKSTYELRAAVQAGILLNVESQREIDRLRQIAKDTGLCPRVAIRVNPDFELKSSGMKIVQRKSMDLALSLARHAPRPPRIINIGGGFGIPYFPKDQALELGPIGENLAGLSKLLETACPQAHLAVELGRYIVGEAGIYVCRVLERKVSRGKVFLITDGGMHHHLAASGNFGQVIRRNFPVLVGNRVFAGDREKVSVVGPLCTPLDLLADNMEMAQAEEGDLIVVFQSGAYGLTASPINFLSHPVAVERLI